jgi:two-component system cell cycle response regulator
MHPMMATNMSVNNMLQESNDLHRQYRLQVMPLGIEAMEMERLKKIFQLAPQGERSYVVAPPSVGGHIDILLVNYDDPEALREKDTLLANNPNIQVVALSRGPLNEAPIYHIRGMLLAARVLSVLDRIPARDPVLRHPPANPPLTVESAPEQPKPQVLSEPAMPVAAPVSMSVNGYRALVVDDSVAMQKSLELNLAALEQIAAVDFADSGESALEKSETTQYDLIFLDVMMPGIDGYETCSRLRKKPEYKKTPIIMVSGKTSPLDEVKGVMAGCTTYVTKPIQKEEFQKLGIRVLAWLANYKPH